MVGSSQETDEYWTAPGCTRTRLGENDEHFRSAHKRTTLSNLVDRVKADFVLTTVAIRSSFYRPEQRCSNIFDERLNSFTYFNSNGPDETHEFRGSRKIAFHNPTIPSLRVDWLVVIFVSELGEPTQDSLSSRHGHATPIRCASNCTDIIAFAVGSAEAASRCSSRAYSLIRSSLVSRSIA